MRTVLLTTLRITGSIVAIGALSYEASAQGKKMMPAEKMAACNTLKNEAACNAGKDCNWVGESKDDKGKVTRKAYCRSNPKPAKG